MKTKDWNRARKTIRAFDEDTISAFVALGGNINKAGQINAEPLAKVCRDLGLTIDIAALIHEIDADGSGFVDFDEFSGLLKSSDADDDVWATKSPKGRG